MLVTFMSISQGEVWLVEFFPNAGSEIGKKRPAIVVSDDKIGKLPLKTIVPVTHWSSKYKAYPWMLELKNSSDNGLSKHSAIDCFQVRNFSDQRFLKRLGVINKALLFDIHQTITKTLNPIYKIV